MYYGAHKLNIIGNLCCCPGGGYSVLYGGCSSVQKQTETL